MTTKKDRKAGEIAGSLSRTIFAWSLSSARSSVDELSEVLLEQGFTARQNRALVMEMLSFFLVMFEHYSLSICSESFLDRVGNRTVQEAINLTADELGRSAGQSDPLRVEINDYYRPTAKDYQSCRFVIEDEPDYDGTRTVIGRLAARISALLDVAGVSESGIAVSSIAAQGLVESGLKNQIEEACSELV